MSHPIEFPQRVHLLDSSGLVTGSFVPEGVLQHLVNERDGLRAEIDRLREEAAHLRQAKQAVEEERDLYLRSLHHLTRKEFAFSEGEILELQQNGVSLGKALAIPEARAAS